MFEHSKEKRTGTSVARTRLTMTRVRVRVAQDFILIVSTLLPAHHFLYFFYFLRIRDLTNKE
jgi:hypothetical protein